MKEILKSHVPLAFGDQSIQVIREKFGAKSGGIDGCATKVYLKPVNLHSGHR